MSRQITGQFSPETTDKVLAVLSQVAQTDEVRHNLDLKLFELNILDSLQTVELLVAFSQELGVEISPAEFERDEWATPRQIINLISDRMR